MRGFFYLVLVPPNPSPQFPVRAGPLPVVISLGSLLAFQVPQIILGALEYLCYIIGKSAGKIRFWTSHGLDLKFKMFCQAGINTYCS
jgi:hypothetical protein